MMLPFVYLHKCPRVARMLCPWPCIRMHQTDAISEVCRWMILANWWLTLHTLSNILISLIFSLYLLILGQA